MADTLKTVSIDTMIDKHIGKRGAEKREAFETELRIDLLGQAIKEARQARNLIRVLWPSVFCGTQNTNQTNLVSVLGSSVFCGSQNTKKTLIFSSVFCGPPCSVAHRTQTYLSSSVFCGAQNTHCTNKYTLLAKQSINFPKVSNKF